MRTYFPRAASRSLVALAVPPAAFRSPEGFPCDRPSQTAKRAPPIPSDTTPRHREGPKFPLPLAGPGADQPRPRAGRAGQSPHSETKSDFLRT